MKAPIRKRVESFSFISTFLLNNKSYAKVMSDNEKKLADEIYDYDKSLEIFVKKVTDMVFKE